MLQPSKVSRSITERTAPLIVVLLMLATFITFAGVCTHDFTWWDDGQTIHHNPRLNPPSWAGVAYYWRHPHMSLYIPVTYSVWGALAYLARVSTPDASGAMLNPWVFHSASVGLHVVNVLLVFAVLRLLSGRQWAAAAGALLFGLHPLQVEAVAWTSGMKDLLCGLFTLTALWQYLRFITGGEERRRMHFALGMVAMALGMLSKPIAMVTPLLALAIDWWVLGRPLRNVLRTLWPWFLLAVPIAVITRNVQPALYVDNAPLWARPLVATDALAFYLYKLVFPVWLALDYGHLPMVVYEKGWIFWTWLAPAAIAVLLYLNRRRRPWLVGTGLLFVGGMLPVLGLRTFLMQFHSTTADHYLYLPMLGVALALAFGLREVPRPSMAWGCAAVLAVLAVRSALQARFWANDDRLFAHTLDVNPRSFGTENNLGALANLRDDLDTALIHFQRAVELKPDYWEYRNNLAIVLIRRGDVDAAIEQVRTAAAIHRAITQDADTYVDNLNLLGQVLVRRGRYAEAIEQFEHALALRPQFPEAQANLEAARRKLQEAATRPASRP